MNKEFLIIPLEIYQNHQLSSVSKILFGKILSLSNKDGYCYASNKYLADSLSLSTRTIIRYIKELKDEGIIDCKSLRGKKRHIYIKNLNLYK